MRRRELQWKARITSFVRQILRAKINFLLGQRDYLTSTTQTKSQKVKKNYGRWSWRNGQRIFVSPHQNNTTQLQPRINLERKLNVLWFVPLNHTIYLVCSITTS
jgi:hypothetical protein